MKLSTGLLLLTSLFILVFSCKSQKEHEGQISIKKGKVTIKYTIAAESASGNLAMLKNKLIEIRLNMISYYIYGMSFKKTDDEVKLQNSGVTITKDDYTLDNVEIIPVSTNLLLEEGELTYMLDVGNGTYECHEVSLEGTRFKNIYNQLLITAVKKTTLQEGKIYPIDDLIFQEKGDTITLAAKFIITGN